MITSTAKQAAIFNAITSSTKVIKDEVNGNLRHLVFEFEGRKFVVDQQDEAKVGICQCWVDNRGYVNYGTTQKIGKTLRTVESFIGNRI